MEYHDTKYENGVNLKELVPHGEEIKDNKKENSNSPSSSKCIVVCFLIFIIILLIIIISVILCFFFFKYAPEIKILNKNIKILEGKIQLETNKLNKMFSKGMIMAWYGKINEIPKNWVICDGTNGTPDLRNRFIIGSSEIINFGTKGGSSSIKLQKSNLPSLGESLFSCDSHYGSWHHKSNNFIKYHSGYSTNVKLGGGDNWGSNYIIDLNEGMESTPIDIMNPYFSLYYIMKME